MSRPPDRDLADAVKLHQAGRLKDAVRLYEKVVRKAPRHAPALNLLGVAYSQAGDVAKAADMMQRALALDPSIPNGHFNLGLMLQHLGRTEEAIAAYQRAVALRPNDAQAISHLGISLELAGRNAEAIAQYRHALSLDPARADLWHSLGNVLHNDKQYDAARAAGERALQLRPGHAATHFNLGNALMELFRFKDAIRHFDAASALTPEREDIHYNRAAALVGDGQDEAALASYDRAIAQKPDYAQALWNKGLLLLSLGRFREGWTYYARRWDIGPVTIKRRDYHAPEWNGERVDGSLLLWGEQGLGDQILYASMIDDTLPFASELVVEVERSLAPLFERSFPKAKVIGIDRAQLYQGKIDAQLAVGDLGRFFRNDAESFPQRPYLKADAVRAQQLRARISPDGRPVIGLSWRSVNPTYGNAKSARLADLKPLFERRDWHFVDLQYGDTDEERAELHRELGVTVQRLPDIDNTIDIDGLAALIEACDAVVSVSNTTVHLACALGKPTWLMVPFGSARLWYWLRTGDRTPWYGAARILRQGAGQAWSELTATAADELSRHLKHV